MYEPHRFIVPSGQQQLVSEVLDNIKDKGYYAVTGRFPPPLLHHLNKGEGRTTILSYTAASYELSGLCRPRGIDRYLDLSVGKGLPADTRRTAATIRSAAVYGSAFGGVIGIDLDGLCGHINEPYVGEFIEELKGFAGENCLVLFLPSEHTKNSLRFEERLCGEIEEIKSLPFEPYTPGQLGDIFMQRLTWDTGVVIEKRGRGKIDSIVSEIVDKCGIDTAAQAVRYADEILHFADFGAEGGRPVLTLEGFRAFLEKKINEKGAVTNAK